MPDKKNIEDIFALTPMQEGMLVHYLHDINSVINFEQLSLKITGDINIEIFKNSWNSVIAANEMLRAVFRWEKLENPLQVILKDHQLVHKYYDFSRLPAHEAEKKLVQIKKKDKKEKFDLKKVPFRVTLCKRQKNDFQMIISFHHIILDGWSTGIILAEFLRTYHALYLGKNLKIPAKNKFKEFVKWMQIQEQNKQQILQNEYLKKPAPTALIPEKIKRKKNLNHQGYFHLKLPGKTVNKWQNFTKLQKITLAALLYVAWGLLWQKYNYCEDISFDITVSGRPPEINGVEHIAGLFINTIPLRLQFPGDEKIVQLLKKTHNILKDPGQVQPTPAVDENYPANQRVFFDCLVVIENYALLELLQPHKDHLLSINSFSIEEITRYDLTFIITAFNGYEFHLTYDRDLFDQHHIQALVNYFLCILEDIAADPGITAVDIHILSAEEKKKIHLAWNNSRCQFHHFKTPVYILDRWQRPVPPCFIGEVYTTDINQDNGCTYKWIDNPFDIGKKIIRTGELARWLPDGTFTLMEPLFNNNSAGEKILPSSGSRIKNKLRQIWSDILNIDEHCIDFKTSFFEFSGHSLKVKILAARIQEELKVKVPIEKIFQLPDINGMAAFIRELNPVPDNGYYSPLVPLEKKEYYELSSAQKRFFVLQQINEKTAAVTFIMTMIYILEGTVDKKRLELSFHQLVQRHESLRTSFHVINGQPVQRVNRMVKLDIEYLQCPREKTGQKIKQLVKPFNLQQAPLFRLALIKTVEPAAAINEKYFLLLDIHHIISDGFSINIILDEFIAGYQGQYLCTPGIQYKDYAVWHKKLTGQTLIDNEKYWSKKLNGALFTQIPVDRFKSYQSVTGGCVRREIPLPLYRQINRRCNQYRVTRFVFLLSLFFIVLEMETGQQDITIASPIVDRDHKALEHLIGVFLNVLLIRWVMDKNMIFTDYLRKMKENFIEALEHSLYPYERLKDRPGISHQWKQGELFSILFNYFVIEENHRASHCPFKIKPVNPQEMVPVMPKYDLTLYVTDSRTSAVLYLVYKDNLYKEYRIERIMYNFIDAIPRVLENPGLKLSDLSITDSRVLGDIEPEAEALFDNDDLL